MQWFLGTGLKPCRCRESHWIVRHVSPSHVCKVRNEIKQWNYIFGFMITGRMRNCEYKQFDGTSLFAVKSNSSLSFWGRGELSVSHGFSQKVCMCVYSPTHIHTHSPPGIEFSLLFSSGLYKQRVVEKTSHRNIILTSDRIYESFLSRLWFQLYLKHAKTKIIRPVENMPLSRAVPTLDGFVTELSWAHLHFPP